MNKFEQELLSSWKKIEAAVGGRFRDGQECPPALDLFRKAQAQITLGQSLLGDEAFTQHLEVCHVCRRTYQVALALADEGGDVNANHGMMVREAMKILSPTLQTGDSGSGSIGDEFMKMVDSSVESDREDSHVGDTQIMDPESASDTEIAVAHDTETTIVRPTDTDTDTRSTDTDTCQPSSETDTHAESEPIKQNDVSDSGSKQERSRRQS